ncbi:MAG: hypothetical protein IT368_08085 [Candidatus Hydrogenedentes bacterium]|jgi:hypothetical protein|nr:hypothetical protein [Candidatus Hydrogenedentota bacterium]
MQTQTVSVIQHPLMSVPTDFRDLVDVIDPLICTREDLLRLQAEAPTREAAAWLAGIIDTRQMMAIVSGREF